MKHSILITIDVEDWFQVENFKSYIPFSTWNRRELRVEKNVHTLLDIFAFITHPYGQGVTYAFGPDFRDLTFTSPSTR